jgi:hypothetical protein
MATVMCVYMHALQLKLERQRTAGSKTPGKSAAAAGRTKLLLPYTIHYCRTQETQGAPEDTRGNKEGHQKDRRAQSHRDTTRTGGHSGGSGETPRGPEGTTGGSERSARPHGSNMPRTAQAQVGA